MSVVLTNYQMTLALFNHDSLLSTLRELDNHAMHPWVSWSIDLDLVIHIKSNVDFTALITHAMSRSVGLCLNRLALGRCLTIKIVVALAPSRICAESVFNKRLSRK